MTEATAEMTPKEMVEHLLTKGGLLINIRSNSTHSVEVRVEALRRLNKNVRDLRTYGNDNEKLEKLLEEMKNV